MYLISVNIVSPRSGIIPFLIIKISLNTNEFIFGLRKDVSRPACEILVFDKLSELRIRLPLQILLELQHNLTDEETRRVLLAVMKAKALSRGTMRLLL